MLYGLTLRHKSVIFDQQLLSVLMEQRHELKEIIAFQVGYVLEKPQGHPQVQWFAKRTPGQHVVLLMTMIY